jgi:hypothetical protein
MKGTVIGGRITEKASGNLVCSAPFCGPSGTDRNRQSAPGNPIGAQYTEPHISNVHGAAFAFAIAALFAEKLGHHTFQVRPFGDNMTVTPMRAGDVIIFPQGPAYAGGNALLPNVEMGKAGYLTTGVQIYDSLFKEATFHHCRVKLKEFVFTYFHETPPHQKIRIGI